jgi:Uma2 family endonuclease
MKNKKEMIAIPLLNDNYKKTEKIDGIIYDMSPSAGYRHCVIDGNIYHMLRNQLKDSLCMVTMENLDLYLSETEYVIPDIMLLCDRKRIIKDKYRGIPKFIVETLSPATSFRDKTIKKEKYAQLGVEEYWIVSPKEMSVEIYYLTDGVYVLKNSCILVTDKEDENYNADTVLTLKAMPFIRLVLGDIFYGLEDFYS